MHIGHDGVPGTCCGIAELGTKRTMVAQDDAYGTKDFAGSRPCADSVDKQISHGSPIGAPQCCYDGPKVGPPRLQFSIRHEWLRLTPAFTCGLAREREPGRQVECFVGRPFVTQLRDPLAARATAGSSGRAPLRS